MKKNLFTILLLLFVGCEERNHTNGGMIPNEVYVWDDYDGIELTTSSSSYKGVTTQYLVLTLSTSNLNQTLSEKAYGQLAEIKPMWSQYIACINQSTEELHIYADKVLWGILAGEPLEAYFLFVNDGRYDLPLTYPNGDVDFSYSDLNEIGDNNDFLTESDVHDILCVRYMTPKHPIFKFKELPPEQYEEVTFTIQLRLGNGKELSASATMSTITQTK